MPRPARKPKMPPALGIADELLAIHAAAGQEPDAMRRAVIPRLKAMLEEGRLAARKELEAGHWDGVETSRVLSGLLDEAITALYRLAIERVYPVRSPTAAEALSVVAVGGYGRGALAPGSDIDLLFLLPYKQTPWGESVVEFMLYALWDLGHKVGHATRSVEQCLRLSKSDMTIRTSVLESRYLCGSVPLFDSLKQRFAREVVGERGGWDFVEAKLAERDERHRQAGESRYLVEPNIKDGKGGLRDLQSLFWIAKYVYRVEDPAELVKLGLFNADEYRSFEKAHRYLWTVRCHLHFLTGRAEERLSFDVQREMARRLGYSSHAGLTDVERFMKHYFIVAKDVGDLTRIFCAALEMQNKKHRRSLGRFLPALGRKRAFGDFIAEGGRLDVAQADVFERDPVNLIRLFHVAIENELDVHPNALKLVTRSLKLIDQKLRHNEEANRLFLEVLASRKDPERGLRAMNEARVLGRFVPDFGRIVAQMQFNMYHHYTVDEHLIRAVGFLSRIERGEFATEDPLTHDLFKHIKNRAGLYVSILLHDIAKGREGDHSDEGAEIAKKLCPRLGLSAAETELVIWLVKYHLAMSDAAQRRDVNDPKTVRDFAGIVQGPERLRLLLLLTVADIRAVGPGTWNGWKGQLLRELYYETEAVLQGGHAGVTYIDRIAQAKTALKERLSDLPRILVETLLERHYPAYWLSLDAATHEKHARMMVEADASGRTLTVLSKPDRSTGSTEVTIYTPDHPGLFSQLAGAFAMCGASIVDAKIFTTTHGMALDLFTIQDAEGGSFDDESRLQRLSRAIESTLKGEVRAHEVVAEKRPRRRAEAFTVEPAVIIDNTASETHTVIEVNGRDRPGLLHDVTRALFNLSLTIASARIATYGERVVDVFYVKDAYGLKVEAPNKLEQIEKNLLAALEGKLPKPARKRVPEPAE